MYSYPYNNLNKLAARKGRKSNYSSLVVIPSIIGGESIGSYLGYRLAEQANERLIRQALFRTGQRSRLLPHILRRQLYRLLNSQNIDRAVLKDFYASASHYIPELSSEINILKRLPKNIIRNVFIGSTLGAGIPVLTIYAIHRLKNRRK